MLSDTVRTGADPGNVHQVPDDPIFGQQQDLHSHRWFNFGEQASETPNSKNKGLKLLNAVWFLTSTLKLRSDPKLIFVSYFLKKKFHKND